MVVPAMPTLETTFQVMTACRQIHVDIADGRTGYGEAGLAHAKALAIEAAPDEIVLAADTTVVAHGELLAKPADAADARRMLLMLSGRRHEVLTGICLRRGEHVVTDHASTAVWFAPLTPHEIEVYIASGEHMDKAGAYAIQGLASKFVERIDGCYFNVMGLPVALVYRHLCEGFDWR